MIKNHTEMCLRYNNKIVMQCRGEFFVKIPLCDCHDAFFDLIVIFYLVIFFVVFVLFFLNDDCY